MLMSEVIEDVLGPSARCALAHSCPDRASPRRSPPAFPTNIVVASTDEELAAAVQQRFATERLRVYSSDDPIGVEVGGALKNVIAIAAGAVRRPRLRAQHARGADHPRTGRDWRGSRSPRAGTC